MKKPKESALTSTDMREIALFVMFATAMTCFAAVVHFPWIIELVEAGRSDKVVGYLMMVFAAAQLPLHVIRWHDNGQST